MNGASLFSQAHPASVTANRPSTTASLSLASVEAAIRTIRENGIIGNNLRPIVLHPAAYEQYQQWMHFIDWFDHLLPISYATFNAQYPDRRWSKRTRQRRYVKWVEDKAKAAARAGIECSWG